MTIHQLYLFFLSLERSKIKPAPLEIDFAALPELSDGYAVGMGHRVVQTAQEGTLLQNDNTLALANKDLTAPVLRASGALQVTESAEVPWRKILEQFKEA